MKIKRKLNRRSFLGAIVGAGALAGSAGRTAAQPADNDHGPNADPVGRRVGALARPAAAMPAPAAAPPAPAAPSDPPPAPRRRARRRRRH
jgi:hypothetical protein